MAYAVIKTGGKQYKVREGDSIDVEKLDVPVGEQTTLDHVLAVSDGASVTVGTPVVDGASVTAEVVAQHRAPKVIAFKFRRRKGYHKTKGHRRHLTRLSIKAINA